MNFSKLRKKLSKLNNLLSSLENSGETPNKIERDLVKNYILDLYETAIYHHDESYVATTENKTENKEGKVQTFQTTLNTSPAISPEKEPKVSLPKPIRIAVEERFEKQESIIASNPEEKEARFAFVEEPEIKIAAEATIHSAPEVENGHAQNVSAKSTENLPFSNGNTKIAEELFLLEVGMEVSDKLANLPLKTLKGAVGINDKILLVNQLFKGDMGKYNEMIDTIDKMGSFQQAKSFIQSEIVTKYNWADEDKANTAKGFIRLINRRFLN